MQGGVRRQGIERGVLAGYVLMAMVFLPLWCFAGWDLIYVHGKRQVGSLSTIERASKVHFPAGARLLGGEARGIVGINAKVTIPRASVESFLAQSRFQKVETDSWSARATGRVGRWDWVSAEIPATTDPDVVVRFIWNCED